MQGSATMVTDASICLDRASLFYIIMMQERDSEAAAAAAAGSEDEEGGAEQSQPALLTVGGDSVIRFWVKVTLQPLLCSDRCDCLPHSFLRQRHNVMTTLSCSTTNRLEYHFTRLNHSINNIPALSGAVRRPHRPWSHTFAALW